MTKINSTDRIVWLGTSDESMPAGPFPDNSLTILLDTGAVWFGRNNTWTFIRPLTMTMDIPLGGFPDSVLLPGAVSGSTNRPVVALGSALPLQPISGLEYLIVRIEEQLGAILTELRTLTLMHHEAFGGLPIMDDLDQIRAGLLAADETITR